MNHPESTPSTVQLILYQNVENWKDPIAQLSDGKISKIEFKQFVMEQFDQLESEFVRLIDIISEKQSDGQKILDDNLKTKAILCTVLKRHGYDENFIEEVQKQILSPASLNKSVEVEVGQS